MNKYLDQTHSNTRLVASFLSITLLILSLIALPPAGRIGLASASEAKTTVKANSTVLRTRIKSEALSGNLEGDSAHREVSVYLPPGYSQNRHTHYPVLYMMHGFTETDLSYFSTGAHTNIPSLTDKAIEERAAKPMIIVTPNAMTKHGGSNYSSGETTGDWETFISEELVSYVDSHFRTLSTKDSRGIAGHSMGGYGALRIGMKHPDVFSAMYILSSCCIDADSNIPDTSEEIESMEDFTAHPERYPDGAPAGIETAVAAAASWAPNPAKPPLYFDSPFTDGELDPEVYSKMVANRPLAMVDQHIRTLRKQNIAFDVGNSDTNILNNLKSLDKTLSSYNVEHKFEVYDGNYTNRIPERFEAKVLPYFSKQLNWN